jgi:hypothetical protein
MYKVKMASVLNIMLLLVNNTAPSGGDILFYPSITQVYMQLPVH